MTSDTSSPVADISARPGSPNAARLARKRATDRKSQRNHRERRRAYVRSLEETVATLRDASSTDERVSSLLAENEALRARCQSLASQLSRIRTIACETARGTHDDPHALHPATPAPLNLDDFEGLFDMANDVSQPSPDEHVPAIDQPATSIPSVGLVDSTRVEHALITRRPATSDCFEMPDAFQTIQDENPLDVTAFISTEGSLVLDSALSYSCSPPLPQYACAQSASDRLLHAMVEEAISEHKAGKFDMSKPSLNRLLTHGPTDTLSFRLFHYINRYGEMPMHLMLAIFWVQYLFLRWNVIRTAEAYALVPHFLRPTSLDWAVPHRISINMLVWPDIRRALIRDALTVNPDDVGVELLKNLPSSWEPSIAMSGDMIASMDIYRMIETQAIQEDFWKVGAGFLHTFPQYKNCNVSTAH